MKKILLTASIICGGGCHVNPSKLAYPAIDSDRIYVTVDPDLADPTKAAIDLIDAQIGCDALLYVGASTIASDISIGFTSGAPCEREPWRWNSVHSSATTYFCADGSRKIELHQAPDVWIQTWLITHELGHAMGLGHSRTATQSDVMAYRAPPVIIDDRPYPMIMFEDSDIKALNKSYCKGHVNGERTRDTSTVAHGRSHSRAGDAMLWEAF